MKSMHRKLCIRMLYVDLYRIQATNDVQYFVTFIDDCTRWGEIYFLREKSDMFEAFKSYQAIVERMTGKQINL